MAACLLNSSIVCLIPVSKSSAIFKPAIATGPRSSIRRLIAAASSSRVSPSTRFGSCSFGGLIGFPLVPSEK